MNNIMLALVGTAGLMAVPAQATVSLKLPSGLAQLSPSEIASKTSVEDDPLEEIVVFSTRKASGREGPARGGYVEDGHARAIVNRATGTAAWQIWHDLAYGGARKEIDAVNYLVGGEIQRAKPITLEHWLDQCPATDAPGQCNQLTRVVFEITEEQIREVAGSHQPGSREPWLMRFKDRNGESVTVGFASGELAGLLLSYDEWRNDVR